MNKNGEAEFKNILKILVHTEHRVILPLNDCPLFQLRIIKIPLSLNNNTGMTDFAIKHHTQCPDKNTWNSLLPYPALYRQFYIAAKS